MNTTKLINAFLQAAANLQHKSDVEPQEVAREACMGLDLVAAAIRAEITGRIDRLGEYHSNKDYWKSARSDLRQIEAVTAEAVWSLAQIDHRREDA